MAKQKSILPLTGTLGDITFYEHKDVGFLAKEKGGPSTHMLKYDDRYDITRRHNSEFGRASGYGKMLRQAFSMLEKNCRSFYTNTRLSSRLREIMWMDKESEFGNRDLRRDTLEMFSHFEINEKNVTSKYLELPVETITGNGSMDIITGVILDRRPKGADAWSIRSIAAGIDLLKGSYSRDVQDSDLFEFEKGSFAVSLHHHYDENRLLFHALGILFYRYDPLIDDYRLLKERNVHAGFMRYVGVES